MESKENDMEAANIRLARPSTGSSSGIGSKKAFLMKQQQHQKLIALPPLTSVAFYDEIRMIPAASAKEPWALKKYLNCCKLSHERLKGI